MSDEHMAYAGYCQKCHALCAAVVDMPNSPRDVAKSVAEFLRDGLRIERVTCETVRQSLAFCDCKKKEREAKKLAQRLARQGQPSLGGEL